VLWCIKTVVVTSSARRSDCRALPSLRCADEVTTAVLQSEEQHRTAQDSVCERTVDEKEEEVGIS